MTKLKLESLSVKSFMTKANIKPSHFKGGITGMRCEGPTTPHVCPSQYAVCPDYTLEVICSDQCSEDNNCTNFCTTV